MASVINVPLKAIIPYHMDSPGETIPVGYALCDGTTLNSAQQDINPGSNYTVPDLRNKFMLGANSTLSAGYAGDKTVSGATGAPGPKGIGGANQVALSVAELAPHTHTFNRQVIQLPTSGPNYLINVRDEVTHTETTGSTGSGTAHENRPQFYGVVFIIRVLV
jgi:microcystin-dependent protein